MRAPTRLISVLTAGAGLLGSVLAGQLLVAPAARAATAGPDYEMPFPCGDSWTGSSRYNHSPSSLAVDWNRTNDLGALMTSAAPGVVSRVADLGSRSYGRYVIVDHGSGRSTLYAHLQAVWITQGQAVDQGQILGQVGSTGGSTGPHLHFEERLDGIDQRSYFHRTPFTMGRTQASTSCGDVPVIGDWDGNGAANVGVFRRSRSAATYSLKRPGKSALAPVFGRPTDEPVGGDWNGDGTGDVGVRRPGWKAFLLRNADGSTTQVTLGRITDVGVVGDWNGDRRTEVGVWSPSTRVWTLRASSGTLSQVTFGAVGDRPVTGDWNGDGRTDLGVFTPSTATFTLRTVSRSGAVTLSKVPFGRSTDRPVAGDWNNDKVADIGTWDPATATFALRLTPKVAGGTATVRRPVWGTPRG